MKAFCYRSGEIVFTRKADLDGAICVGDAPAKILRRVIGVKARHAYNGKSLLVPGLPEAETEVAAESALVRFMDQVKDALPRYV